MLSSPVSALCRLSSAGTCSDSYRPFSGESPERSGCFSTLETTTEVCYFIGSRKMAARRYLAALRNHWGIENNLHWQLDVTFHEDASRVENRHGAENLSLFRKLALSLLKQNPRQETMARKRKAAAVDPGFLAEILTGANRVEEI